jgi:hypothetical protein
MQRFLEFLSRRRKKDSFDSAEAIGKSLLNAGHLKYYEQHRAGDPDYKQYTLRFCLETERNIVAGQVMLGAGVLTAGEELPPEEKRIYEAAKEKLAMMDKVLAELPKD